MTRGRPKAPKEAKPETRTKTLHYKRARLIGDSGSLTLAQLLDAAVSKKKPPMSRMERLGDSLDNIRVINQCNKLGTIICGQFLDYTQGGAQMVLNLDPNAEELEIEELPPTEKRQYLEGILYFGVRDNHAILVQSKGLRVGHLENHINWLLSQHANVLPTGSRVVLEDEPRRELTDKLSVDWVELQAPVSVASFVGAERIPKGLVRRLVRALQGTVPLAGTIYERLNAEDALKLQDVELSLRITRKGRGQKRAGHSLVDEIAHTLRHVDDVEFKLKTRGGATLTSTQLKLTTGLPIRSKPGGKLELDSVAEVMQGWLSELITQRHIETA